MPIPNKNFNGKALLSYGYCSEPGKYIQKDLDEVNIFDYYDKYDIIEGENIEVLNKLKGEYEEVEFVKCKIESNLLSIDDILYTYIEKDDIFLSINVDKKDEYFLGIFKGNEFHSQFVRIHALYDTCELCGSSEEFIIPYNHSEKWICNNCIYDTIDYHNNYFMKSHY